MSQTIEIHCKTGRVVVINAESLEGANLDGMDLHRAVLQGVNLRGAKLRRATLRNADLRGADLREADLSGAALMLAELAEARLNGAIMRFSRPIAADLRSADLQLVDLTGADVGLAHMEGAILKGACMRCDRLEQASLEGATYDQYTHWPDGFDPEIHCAMRNDRSPQRGNETWAVTLDVGDEERLETRLLVIIEHVTAPLEQTSWGVDDIDASGPLGDKLTQLLNEARPVRLTTRELSEILSEDGQIIEMDATLEKDTRRMLRIVVRDGSSVDVLGKGQPPDASVLGKHTKIAPELFLWE